MNFNKEYNRYLSIFNEYLNSYLSSLEENSPKNIRDVMSYALLNGGKRVRPVLCLATAKMLGLDFSVVLPFALAIEMIHSYSLVHDDLPAMDNDDYRRGKLSTHKAFGEAMGILAGDGLLNLSVEVCLSADPFDSRHLRAMQHIYDFSGYKGMIGGQVLDILSEDNNQAILQDILKIYENKTAKLITLPLIVASELANKKYFDNLFKYGYSLGLCFQIIDDIMDEIGTLESIGKTPKKDAKMGKNTSVSILGIDEAKELAFSYYNDCLESIKDIPNNDFLLELAKFLLERNN